MDEQEQTSLKEQIAKLNANLEQANSNGKIKKFKPNKKLSNSDLKSNVVLGIIVGENKAIRFEKLTIEDSTVSVNKVPRIATAEYLATYQGKPALIIPEWSVEPISFQKNYDQAVRDRTLSVG